MCSTPSAKSEAAPEPPKPKKLWDSILTSTPVVLTVVATLLAGLSTSEMSRAQYYRALAAQHQSKAGDQWGFFQAKRTRGGSTEMTVELLRAQNILVPVSGETIAEFAARLPRDLDRIAKVSERLLGTLSTAKTETGANSPRDLLEKLVQTAQQKATEARALEIKLTEALARPEVREALAYLNTTELPEAVRETVGNAKIDEAHRAILARKTEEETESLMAEIREEELRQAVNTAEENARAFDEKGKPVDSLIASVAQLIKEATALTGVVHHIVERVNGALADLAASDSGPVRVAASDTAANEMRNLAAALVRADNALTKSADEMNQSFVAARRDFTARRYEREARDNQEIAGVYEIQVRKSSGESERHRKRSQLFFVGMLIAQAGVTIATFALAMRQRSVLWVLATIAGLAAIAFSGYVYLFT